MRLLESAIEHGTPVILENVGEELDPSIGKFLPKKFDKNSIFAFVEPVLLKTLYKEGGIEYIKFSETAIPYSSDFRLYITTRMNNPHYLPDVAIKVRLS